MPPLSELLGTWIEDTADPDDPTIDLHDYSMHLHALVLARDADGRLVARYGMIFSSNVGTDERHGEGTWEQVDGGIIVRLPAMMDWSDADAMGYDCRRSRFDRERLTFTAVRRDGALALTSHLREGSPVVPAAVFVRDDPDDPLRVAESLDELADRARDRQGRSPDAP